MVAGDDCCFGYVLIRLAGALLQKRHHRSQVCVEVSVPWIKNQSPPRQLHTHIGRIKTPDFTCLNPVCLSSIQIKSSIGTAFYFKTQMTCTQSPYSCSSANSSILVLLSPFPFNWSLPFRIKSLAVSFVVGSPERERGTWKQGSSSRQHWSTFRLADGTTQYSP